MTFEKTSIKVFIAVALLAGIFLGFIIHAVESQKDIRQLSTFQPALPTRIYDVEGRLIAELFQHKRDLVHLNQIPRPVVAAFLAVEDSNFYNHFGIDFKGILRAMFANLKAMSIVQGGSTLTQQLVKGLYTESERTLSRKLYEAILALEVEYVYSKEQILEMYFNQTYFGHGAYGISAAARFYFDKSVEELTLMEGAVLAALPKSPHTYSPIRSPHQSRDKNRVVLNRLVELQLLTKEESNTLYDEFWKAYWKKIIVTPPSINMFGTRTNQAPYFVEMVRQELIGMYGEEAVYRKGLQVYTSLNLDYQKKAEEAMVEVLKELDPVARAANKSDYGGVDYTLLSTYNSLQSLIPLPGVKREYSLRNDFRQKMKDRTSDAYELLSLSLPLREHNELSQEFLSSAREFKSELEVQGAFIALEHKTGRIMSLIGGREFKSTNQFNRAILAKRQPGSAFKPFVYGAALEDRAVHYAMGFLDAPLINIQPDGSQWEPVNYEGTYQGYVPLFRALALSLNLVSVQVYDKVGPDKIIQFASRITKAPIERFQPNPSLALGASELTPMEMATGMSVIANEGRDVIPHGILYITDRDGNVLTNVETEILDVLNYKKKKGEIQLIEEGVAFILRKMMENVVSGGTASRGIRVEGGFTGHGAGKTGTTSGWNDAWFSGFTRDYTATIWLGMDNGSMTLGRHQSGGMVATRIWGKYMAHVYQSQNRTAEPFSQELPKGVKTASVCRYTGKWPNPACDKEFYGTYYMDAIKVGNQIKRIGGEQCDCHHIKSESILDILQEQNSYTDEEIGKKSDKFRTILQ